MNNINIKKINQELENKAAKARKVATTYERLRGFNEWLWEGETEVRDHYTKEETFDIAVATNLNDPLPHGTEDKNAHLYACDRCFGHFEVINEILSSLDKKLDKWLEDHKHLGT